jgi:hypothetical protein
MLTANMKNRISNLQKICEFRSFVVCIGILSCLISVDELVITAANQLRTISEYMQPKARL